MNSVTWCSRLATASIPRRPRIGAFLMPADAIRAEVGASRSSISIGELVALKGRFGASIQAIAYR